ncbi:hypothetical protein FGB62_27g08 [Gracilaria domingensis]|nr:hypothetical protein FGB62_27g08 [Gracilaria domingensis]
MSSSTANATGLDMACDKREEFSQKAEMKSKSVNGAALPAQPDVGDDAVRAREGRDRTAESNRRVRVVKLQPSPHAIVIVKVRRAML